MGKKRTLFKLAESQAQTLAAMEGYYDSIAEYFKNYNEILGKAAKMLIPLVRKELLNSLANSGLNMNAKRSASNKTKRLADMVANATVYTSSKAVVITMARGYKDEDYQKANALEHGAVRGKLPWKRGTKQRTAFKRALEKSGARSTVITVKTESGEDKNLFVTRIPAHPYFGLTPAQITVINAAFIQNVAELINQKMRDLGRRAA